MKRRKGLTLIECLISMLVLGILLVAGMAFYFNAQASMRWSIHKRIALELANSELENIKNNGYACLPNPAPNGLWTAPDCNTHVHTGSVSIGNITGQQSVYVSDIDENGDSNTDYKQVRVVVNWQDPGKSASQSVSLDTYIAP